MAHLSTELQRPRPSPRLEIGAPLVAARLQRGKVVGVYHGLHSDETWPRRARAQVEIRIFFKAGTCYLGWLGPKSEWCHLEHCGRHVHVVAAEVENDCRLGGAAEVLILYLDPAWLQRERAPKLRGVEVIEAVENDFMVWMLAAVLRHLCTQRERPSPRTIDAMGGELALSLLDSLRDPRLPQRMRGPGFTPAAREKLMRFIQDNLKYDIHVVDLAKQTGHSPSHFTELFVNTTGRAPYHFLKEARALRAHELILGGNYRVAEVAAAVGYSNVDHFTEMFREFTGSSPRDLLKRLRMATVEHRA